MYGVLRPQRRTLKSQPVLAVDGGRELILDVVFFGHFVGGNSNWVGRGKKDTSEPKCSLRIISVDLADILHENLGFSTKPCLLYTSDAADDWLVV